jgi:hypothetical protein
MSNGKRRLALCFVASIACSSAALPPGGAAREPRRCPPKPPSYESTVAPIFSQRCLRCHAGDGEAAEDHDFSTLANIRRARASIDAKVSARAMPPPGEPPLTDSERAEILVFLACQPTRQ